jgi:acyl-[acyl-carrier-protein]-phospholipid O-acyltransferase/long-chain-fatty-acid--[acyl-carrier-protein] ligase
MLKKMGNELPNIALPKHFIVIKELPMMGTGKIDFRSVTKIVQEILSNSESDQVLLKSTGYDMP